VLRLFWLGWAHSFSVHENFREITDMAQNDSASNTGSNTETSILTSENGGRTEGDTSAAAASSVAARGEVSAVTVARMMGLATLGEVKLIESKVELLTSKLSLVQAKLEKVASTLQSLPTGADLERIDVHIGSMKQMLKEVLGDKAKAFEEAESKKPSSKIVSN